MKQAVEQGDVEHISVFAFAPIPLLVYLGSRLDDKTTTKIFQKHRGQNAGWSWLNDGKPVTFAAEAMGADRPDADVVLVCEISSPVDPANFPPKLQDCPRYVLRPKGRALSPVLLTNEQSLINLAFAWRTMLAEVEAAHPRARRWHLIASVPLSVGVEVGRAFMRGSQPRVTVYERNETGYVAALEVNV